MTNRELDALVAEKVMGWATTGYVLGKGVAPLPCDAGPVCLMTSDVPFYSTDIAAAWEVVAKFIGPPRWNAPAEHDCFALDIYYMGNGGDWEWEVHIQGEDRISHIGCANMAPRAICLAALKAVGVEVME